MDVEDYNKLIPSLDYHCWSLSKRRLIYSISLDLVRVSLLKSESVRISSEGQTLHGVLSHGGSDVKPGVVLLHPHPLYGGDMDNHVVTTLERVLLEAEFPTLRFDFRGASTSPQGYSGVSGAVTDALNAIDFLKSHIGVSDVGIVGYSFGASTALRLALLRPPPFLITLSASCDLVSEDGFDIKNLVDIECPIMMFHGRSDQMIPIHDLTVLAEAIGLEKTNKVVLDGEGHFYQRTLPDVVTSVRKFISGLVT